MSKATVYIVDEVRARVVVEHKQHLDFLINKYSYYAKNHFFNRDYKMGRWDGKISFFNSQGQTFNVFLPDIFDFLVRMGYEVDLKDQRAPSIIRQFAPITKTSFSHIVYPDTGLPFEFADHQVEVVNTLLADTNGIAEAATGAGKSAITAAMCDRFIAAKLKTIVIVPSVDLINNTRDEMIMLGITDVGVLGDQIKDTDHAVVVSTWQTLKNIPFMMKQFTCVIVDETHGVRGQVLSDLLVNHGSHIVYRYGLTGTMPDDPCENATVRAALGPVRVEVSAEYLIKIGWLASLNIDIRVLQEDLREEYKEFMEGPVLDSAMTYAKFKRQYLPDYKAEKAYISKKKKRVERIAAMVDDIRQQHGNTFVLVTDIKMGKKLAEMVPNSTFVYGNDKSKVRAAVYSAFKDRDDVLVFASIGIAAVGINIKRIFNLVLVDLGKSFIRTIQSIGRGLRKGADKDHLVVYDVCSDLKYGTKHRKERMKYYEEKSYPYKVTEVDY